MVDSFPHPLPFSRREQTAAPALARRAGLSTLFALLGLVLSDASAAPAPTLPTLRVSTNQRFLVTAEGRPFFWLADTAWEIFHRLDRADATAYLETRAQQGYNVIQAVALAEFDGLTQPNPYGDLPLLENDPTRPAITPGDDPAGATAYDYWDHVDFVVTEANRRGMYVGLLPTWGDKWNKKWGTGPEVFTPANAAAYGEWIGRRYAGRAIIWILGGDRPVENDRHREITHALAQGLRRGDAGRHLITFHPSGSQSSSQWFHHEPWLDFNLQQTGHSPVPSAPGQKTSWQRIAEDYGRTPVKPVIDGEPLYEDHPIGFRAAKELGYSFDAHVRQRAYWHVFSGACGHTYGNHTVWQMAAPGRKPVNGPLTYWPEALHRPGGTQMRFLRALIESRPMLERVPDQSLVVDPLRGPDHLAATRGRDYAFIYSAQGRSFTVNLGKISGSEVTAWWFNPRNGAAEKIGTFANTGTRAFTPHPHGGFGTDLVLALDDAARNYPPPGVGLAP
ncbi:MAG: glycoside hydrolase family 140 protein [Verrucomicrobia bacterium]|nr:glycoside hydrolase family 140 protein [Verrucomicrobiota bacterium]